MVRISLNVRDRSYTAQNPGSSSNLGDIATNVYHYLIKKIGAGKSLENVPQDVSLSASEPPGWSEHSDSSCRRKVTEVYD